MKLQSLKYFVVLAEELHFGKAALRLSITQPPLSTAIKLLEDELGVTLFNRNKVSVQLTEVGQAFLVEANNILENVERAKNLALSIHSGMVGKLSIGFCGTLIVRDILKKINDFKNTNKNIEVTLHEMNSQMQIDGLQRGNIDVGFMYGSLPPEGIHSLPWQDDYFCICLPKSHPLNIKTEISIKDVSKENFIMFEKQINPINHDNLMSIFSNANFNPKITFYTKNWMTSLAMVSEGCGVAIVPSSLEKLKMEGVKIIPLSDGKIISQSMVVWKSSSKNMVLDKFIYFLKH